jgi:hypothetical protein
MKSSFSGHRSPLFANAEIDQRLTTMEANGGGDVTGFAFYCAAKRRCASRPE